MAATANGKDKRVTGAKDTATRKRVYRVMFIALILDLLAFTSILPLLPSIMEYFDKRDDDYLYAWLKSSLGWLQTKIGVPDQFTPVVFGGL
jgi:hypothetical protein